MLNYPPEITESCKHCGAMVTMRRQGDGRPWHGRLRYWYVTDHECAEGDRAMAEVQAERRQLEEALNPPG